MTRLETDHAMGQTKAVLQAEDFVAFFFAAVMTLGPLATTALYWR